VYGAVYAAASRERRIGRVDDRVADERRDVAYRDDDAPGKIGSYRIHAVL